MNHQIGDSGVLHEAADAPARGLRIEHAARRLYAASPDALIIVDLTSLSIVEANRAAAERLARTRIHMVGSPFLQFFGAGSSGAIRAVLDAFESAGCRRRGVDCKRRDGSPVRLELSLVRSGSDSFVLVHFAGSGMKSSRPVILGGSALAVFDESCDGFVVTDADLRVDYANRAFVEMVGGLSAADLNGDSLTRWLDFTQCDLTSLTSQWAERQAAHEIDTTLRRPLRANRRVQVCAIAVPDGPDPCWGFRIQMPEEISSLC